MYEIPNPCDLVPPSSSIFILNMWLQTSLLMLFYKASWQGACSAARLPGLNSCIYAFLCNLGQVHFCFGKLGKIVLTIV